MAKLASMEVLPELIRYGEVRAESRMDSKNRNVEYDYLIAPLRVDDTQYWVTMDIKKYGEGVGNRFYVHNIVLNREQKDVPTKPSSVEVYTDPASSMEHPFVDQSISQDNAEVNTSIRSGQLDDTPDVQYSIAGRQAANKEIRDQKAKEKIMKSDRNMNSQKQDSLQNQTEGAEIAEANTPLSQRNSRRQTSINQSISQDNAEVNTSVRSGQSDDTPDVQHSIAGRQAANANQSLMNQAMVEAEQGRSADEIWQDTGWIKGQDGKWRFEIDDSSASLVGKAFQNLKDGQKVDLQDILHHPELMENYPQLKGIKVTLDGNLRGYDAVYEPSNRMIRFSGEGVKKDVYKRQPPCRS